MVNIAQNTERIDRTNARIDQLDARLSSRLEATVLDLNKIHDAL